jgi:hypothetical protein
MLTEKEDISLAKLTLVNFPNSLRVPQIKHMFKFFWNRYGWTSEYRETLNVIVGDLILENYRGTPTETVSAELRGHIRSPEIYLPGHSFHCFRNRGTSEKRYDGIHFFTTPGYDLCELRPEEVKSMRTIKQGIEHYFQQRRK